ncbi:MAG: aspartyl/glutamyl-tRNA amidotransferase subunit A [Candidatus Moranbacteria bacterium RIFOXYA12_FULL_35_19]|nr:MAG: Glutamyl-tRNA(Gln) amidotransferase subunit A [Candidatus Moranbacteria bacterium GW2011_GWF2_35_39]OGI32604.1 MAG: aspartyl/glutamyl-tRNA amidotransferase subunit A [Candidatus Moranbacteria bacterium RIFOXYC12_FULL_36_13]OGI32889.1 MAG: aspartyl/glutamyl-tRNA amidotransferase subunit A [Candidatus Moranbacteria bacterium RIFOXYB12_FULL_35_8]OGI36481.1 MAG: aspartyl/glutamyl-tRNA amidotransferase subunit A [Candidatus Moranbacteria bacterium RIFOXYA12_FULL_35_19]
MIRELHEKLISGEITSTQLVEQYFAVISQKNKDINAYLTLTKELALEQAKKVDEKISRGEEIGILEGIPGAIKDNICIENVRTTAGSKILDNYTAPYDATVIKKLKEAGAIILGKTNLDEFAMGSSTENSAYGATKNPRDPERVAGGSSGGSASVVASDMAVWSLGSDTGGSIRQPASFCGIVGLKPTYGRVSRYGLIAMASSLDQIGPMAKSVEDTAIILSIISEKDKLDATSTPSVNKKYEDYLTGEIKNLKIGIVKEYLAGLNEDVKKIINGVIEKYKKLGAQIVEIELPNAKYALPTYYIIQPCETSSNLARFDGIKYGMRADDKKNSDYNPDGLPKNLLENYLDTRAYELGAEVKRRIMLGTYALSSGYYDAYYLRAQKVRTLIKQDFQKAFSKVDLILTPTTPSTAFKLGEKTQDPLQMYLEDIFTITANIAGVPAISVPGGEIKNNGKNLPIGFQLLGKWFDEETLLNTAYTFEVN